MKASAFIPEALSHPKFGTSQEPNETALNLAFNTDLPVFPWYELPENAQRLRRFGIAMRTANMFAAAHLDTGAFGFSLDRKSVV